ncbi:MAG: hypothetical protein K0U98_13680 [Deltaproteobacteria bacterium]|nr:hypothetical protein [Deltaproteobacteria bacterium]
MNPFETPPASPYPSLQPRSSSWYQRFVAALSFVFVFSYPASAESQQPVEPLVADALGDHVGTRDNAIEALRALGPASLEALLPPALEASVTKVSATKASLTEASLATGEQAALDTLDRVCAMKDCAVSRLFWYTDLDTALEAARQSDRPVLSLRLLGRLDEDLSCANSRFFRTALYPDNAVGNLLRDEFVLHWQSVRSVPRVVVDYGDGRQLEGTLTGNSIHYVLDSQGRLIDALPGLYDPKTFFEEVRAAGKNARRAASLSEDKFVPWVQNLHSKKRRNLDASLRADLGKIGFHERFESLRIELHQLASSRSTDPSPSAHKAALRATSKAIVEAPVLSRVGRALEAVEPAPGSEIWPLLANLHLPDVHLDENSLNLLHSTHGLPEGPEARAVIEAFEESLALDTIRNQQLWRRTIHLWLEQTTSRPQLEAFNERIYGQLFLTPLDDPWLGLAPRELYSGLLPPKGQLVGPLVNPHKGVLQQAALELK